MGLGKRYEALQGGWVGPKRSFLSLHNYAMTPYGKHAQFTFGHWHSSQPIVFHEESLEEGLGCLTEGLVVQLGIYWVAPIVTKFYLWIPTTAGWPQLWKTGKSGKTQGIS